MPSSSSLVPSPAGTTSSARPVTIRQVAQRAGVSLGTVSNALNRPEVLAPDTLARVLTAIDELGFVRHAGAALLRGGRARSIGLVLLDITNPFFLDLARGVENAAYTSQQLTFLCSSNETLDRERDYLQALQEQRVPGVIISPINEDSEMLEALRLSGIAVILLGRPKNGFCSVGLNDHQGGAIAANHLLDLGHKKILYLANSTTLSQYRDRFEGALAAIKASGSSAALDRKTCEPEQGSLSKHLVEEIIDYDAVICGNDLTALALQRSLAKYEPSGAEQLSIIGYDDISAAADSPWPLTTIRQPAQQLGAMAVDLLRHEINEPDHRHDHIVIDPSLIVRSSTRRA